MPVYFHAKVFITVRKYNNLPAWRKKNVLNSKIQTKFMRNIGKRSMILNIMKYNVSISLLRLHFLWSA